MVTDWQWQSFSQISGADLYSVLAARQQVFILEQRCLYPDMDGLDLRAHHLLGWHTIDGRRQLAAYLRCLAPGAKYAEMSLGRVLTTAQHRSTGIGRQLVLKGIAQAQQQHPGHRIRIGAQLYLERFYTDLGFQSVSDPYNDDGIMHIEMLR
jgi:ElaA protein